MDLADNSGLLWRITSMSTPMVRYAHFGRGISRAHRLLQPQFLWHVAAWAFLEAHILLSLRPVRFHPAADSATHFVQGSALPHRGAASANRAHRCKSRQPYGPFDSGTRVVNPDRTLCHERLLAPRSRSEEAHEKVSRLGHMHKQHFTCRAHRSLA